MAHTFTIFSFLPTELRVKIWHFAFNFFPRVIELKPSEKPDITVSYRRWEALASTTLTLLQVNREARYEFLPLYASPFSIYGIEPYHTKSLLINYETDILYFRIDIMADALAPKLFWRDICAEAEEEIKNNLRILAGNDRFWCNMMPINSRRLHAGFREFENFKRLQAVIVVPLLEERLHSTYGSPRLVGFEECPARGPYEAAYVPWFNEGFNSTSRNVPVVTKLCREIVKVEQSVAL